MVCNALSNIILNVSFPEVILKFIHVSTISIVSPAAMYSANSHIKYGTPPKLIKIMAVSIHTYFTKKESKPSVPRSFLFLTTQFPLVKVTIVNILIINLFHNYFSS